jgi:hypothetical protein
MPGPAHQSTGDADHRPVAAAIGTCLAAMYDRYVHTPLPERLTLLLAKIDDCGGGPESEDAQK